jgi:accessory gene regulator protein AgrB
MLKRLLDWTPRDIAYWEKIRQRGLWKFIVWYGILITGGLLFIVFGMLTTFFWLRQAWGKPVTASSLYFLLGQLIFVLLVCLLGGITNSLVTWVVENRLYVKYKERIGN